MSSEFYYHYHGRAVPYLIPVLQTCLTISVYTTVAIAVNGVLIVNLPAGHNAHDAHPSSGGSSSAAAAAVARGGLLQRRFKFRHVNVALVTCLFIFVASGLFNLSRWFEYEQYVYERLVVDPATGEEVSEKAYSVDATELRRNATYVRYYSLIGSGIVMVFVPLVTLIIAYAVFHRSLVPGTQKRRIFRLMTVIILLFLLCHLPKVSNLSRVTFVPRRELPRN